MLWVFLVSLPVIIVNGEAVDSPLGLQDAIGWLIWCVKKL